MAQFTNDLIEYLILNIWYKNLQSTWVGNSSTVEPVLKTPVFKDVLRDCHFRFQKVHILLLLTCVKRRLILKDYFFQSLEQFLKIGSTVYAKERTFPKSCKYTFGGNPG